VKVLLDECLPRKLKAGFTGHDCKTVPEAGLAGKKNGVLLSLAEDAGFDVFLTMDKGLQYQQNLAGRSIACPRQIEPSSGFAPTRGSVSVRIELDPAGPSHTDWRIERIARGGLLLLRRVLLERLPRYLRPPLTTLVHAGTYRFTEISRACARVFATS
jgi:hypothetical protein